MASKLPLSLQGKRHMDHCLGVLEEKVAEEKCAIHPPKKRIKHRYMWWIYVHVIGVQTPTWHRKCDSCLRIDQLAEKGNGSQKRSEIETEAQIFRVSSLKAEAVRSCSVVQTFCIGLYRVPAQNFSVQWNGISGAAPLVYRGSACWDDGTAQHCWAEKTLVVA